MKFNKIAQIFQFFCKLKTISFGFSLTFLLQNIYNKSGVIAANGTSKITTQTFKKIYKIKEKYQKYLQNTH